MKIVKPFEYDFCPYIKTEETICQLIERDAKNIDDKYNFISIPLAHLINTKGVMATNQILNSINVDNRIFVCQHIQCKNLVFRDSDIIFTPHSSKNSKFISIPHYAVNYDQDYGYHDKYLFSFIGSVNTHNTRRQIVDRYPTCFDSKKHWGLDKGLPEEFKRNYIEMIGDSKFSICPRGTGISSVRLFESMAMGTIPVIIADNYDPPLSNELNWNEFSVVVAENQIHKINEILNEYSEDDIKKMSINVLDIYNTYFSNDKLHKVLLEKLKLENVYR